MIVNSIKSTLFWGKLNIAMHGKVEYYRQVLANQQLSKDELDELNWSKLKSIVAYAFNHVPFYRMKYTQAGLCPDDIKSRTDYARIPILQKDDIRQITHELISDDAEERFTRESATGGSTGVPVKVLHDTRFHYEALLWRMLGWWGILPEMNSAYVFRERRKRRVERWANAAMWWPTIRTHLDASHMTEQNMSRFVRRMNAIHPQLLQGYVGAVYELARFIEAHRLGVPSPRAIWVTSSPISLVQRQKIESVFSAPVYDQYGCGEVFAVAGQCGAKEGLHVFWDARYIEFVDTKATPVRDRELGRVLVTDLENRVFPLIRYENGDAGRFLGRPCSCGRSLPIIDSVNGRISDAVTLPDGSTVSGDYLTTLFDAFPETVQAFQIRQGQDYSIRLLYVPAPGNHQTEVAVLMAQREIEKRCKGQAPVLIERVPDIPHDRGKLRFVISEVTSR